MNPQLGSRAGRSEHLTSTFAQGSLDHLFFLDSKLLRQPRLAFRPACKRLPRKPTLIHREILRVANDYRSLDDVLQFANITWPGIRYKELQSLLIDPTEGLSRFSCEMTDEVFDQQANVFSSFPQWRNLNRKNVETIKQIATKCTRGDGSLQVAIGGGNDPHVRSDRLIATHTLKLPLLQNTQQRNLSFRGQLTDFVKEDGAFFSKLESTQPPQQCPVKAPLS
jgi:hypothetical protein